MKKGGPQITQQASSPNHMKTKKSVNYKKSPTSVTEMCLSPIELPTAVAWDSTVTPVSTAAIQREKRRAEVDKRRQEAIDKAIANLKVSAKVRESLMRCNKKKSPWGLSSSSEEGKLIQQLDLQATQHENETLEPISSSQRKSIM